MPDRWEQINRLWDAALNLPEDQRPAFLEQNCRGDEQLRREVESLLSHDNPAKEFIVRPAFEMTAEKSASGPPSLVGRKLGPYQILNVLGVGGMGEVYRARDTRLNRTVAIKVLPKHLSDRPDLRQRFEREARAVASLDHPHICALYDIGQEGETYFLVMQYLEGETLSQQLKKGMLPMEEVLRHAIQIAGALDAAHRKGVIHRDLKPGNIMLTQTGAKLLDFGLAKQSRPPLTRGDSRGVTAKESKSLTEEGMILGTLEYMAPEQLEGKEADTSTDIFALGVVIYEMATGRKAFEGGSKASLIAKILTFQLPPIGTIQPVSLPELDTLVQKCLAKKPEERWQSAAELSPQLREIAEAHLETLKTQKRRREPNVDAKEIGSKPKPAVSVASVPEPRNLLSRLIRSRAWKLSLVGMLMALIIGFLVVRQVQRPQNPPEKPKEISLKALTTYPWDNPLDCAAISADGKYLAFSLKGKLFIQTVSSGEKSAIPLPEGFYPEQVYWFPDGTRLLLCRVEEGWIQVKGQATRKSELSLWSLSILGGDPKKLVDNVYGPTVSPDGSLIAFGRFDPELNNWDTWLVSANGEGARKFLHSSQPNQHYGWPVWSPNGQRLFYMRSLLNWNSGDFSSASIESCDLRGENVTTAFSSKARLLYLLGAPNGRIFFCMHELAREVDNFNLWEIKVDVAMGRSLSQAQRLTQLSAFNWVEAREFSITADAKRLVLLRSTGQADVYVAELEPGGKFMKNPWRLTLNETDDAVWDWTADSKAVLFDSNRNGNYDIFRQDINQTDAETVVATPEDERHPNLSPDAAFILYLVSEKRNAPAKRLMRVPAGGGPPEQVLSGEKIKNFSCAREANLCVVVEEVEGKQILTTFDPLKGRCEKLRLSDYPDFAGGILSPQGRLIEKMKPGPDGLYIRVRSLKGGRAEEITFKNLTGDYQFSGWALDGKGIYLWERESSDFTALVAGLDGHSQILWKRGTSSGWSFHYPVPSPNAQYLAFTSVAYERNAWMLENF